MRLSLQVELASIVAILILLNVFAKIQNVSVRRFVSPLRRIINYGENFTLSFETVSTHKLAKRDLHRNDSKYGQGLAAYTKLFIDDYAKWHTQQREICRNDPNYSRTISILVFSGEKRNFGLGDRVRAILHCFLMAAGTKRLFLIDLQLPFPLQSVWGNAPGVNFTYDSQIFPVFPNDSQKNLTRLRGNAFQVYATGERVIWQESMPHLQPSVLRKGLEAAQNLPMYADAAKNGLLYFKPDKIELAALILRTLFRPSFELRARLVEQRPFRGEEYVSLHARLGVGLGENSARFNTTERGMTLEECAYCLGRLASQLAKKHLIQNVFFSTDTRDANNWIVAGIRQELPGAAVAFSTGETVHMKRLNRNKRGTEHFEIFVQTFVDVGLLGGGKAIVYVKSGFAHIASWLGAMEDAIPVDVLDCRWIRDKNLSLAEVVGGPISKAS